MDHHSARLLLLLLLTCLAGFSASQTEPSATVGQYGPSLMSISGVDVVTVGIPYGFQCIAHCNPSCQYSWIQGNMTTQGPELSLQLLHLTPPQILTCIAVNPATGNKVTIHKTLQVTAGPSNIQISGPGFLTAGAATNFTCSAYCYPSCSFSWSVVLQEQVYSTAQGNTISITPPASTVASETLICQAEDTVSHLYISKSLFLWVASSSNIAITGDSKVVMGQKYSYICSASCIPSCQFTWKYMGKTFQGDEIQIPILHQGVMPKSASQVEITFSDYSKTEPLTCEATNTVSHDVITTTMNLTVIDPISVHPASQNLPVSGKGFSLQCVGSQNPASIIWLRNSVPIPASDRVQYSPHNITMTFNPLLQADDGLYQCVVAEGETPIQSIGYQLQVNYGPSLVVISGVDVVTVGVQYSFQCSASCYPTCQVIWISGNLTSQGPELSLQYVNLQPTQNLTCTAFNPATGVSLTAQKTLQMTAGPSNIQISGPAFLTPGVASNFTCSANCYPSCNYTWTVVVDEDTYGTAQGNTISVTPPASTVVSETLICEAVDTTSQLHVSKSLVVQVASLSNIIITGDSAVEMGKQYIYTCSAMCIPSCVFTWKYMGKTVQEDKATSDSQLDITFSDYSKTESLTCEVMNALSNTTISTTKDLTVIDPFSVRPSSQALPVAGEPFSLQCIGPQDPVSITWLKNNQQIQASERVHLSPNNITVTFSPLLRADGGVYQCLVVEDVNQTLYHNSLVIFEAGTPVLSVAYVMQVNYGPDEVLIVKPNKEPVGQEMFTLAGSTTELQCLTDCFPVCSITWFYRGTLLSTNASIMFTPVTPPYETSLTCVALNAVTKRNRTAETTVVVPDGPKNVIISGPDSLEIGETASFTCSAQCSPSCSFTWTLYGKTMTGSSIDITVNRYISQESISCQAENTYTGKTAIFNETLGVSDPHWCGC